jgi:D-alanyl-lipoteichoic acid acyltransferase DltB (MBOAT superfamily)
MLFNTDEFIFLFLPGTLIGFFLLGRIAHHRACLLWLVVCSLFYYGWWNPMYVFLVGGSMVFNYTLGQYIVSVRDGGDDRRAQVLMLVGVAFNLALIAYFKYANFFVDTANDVTGGNWSIGEILLPIGISFFTFQQIAYLVDARRGGTAEYDFVQYSLFVLFFPQLIAGPIVHHKEMLPQFAEAHTYRPSWANISVGGTIFIIGLFKKVVIADNLAPIANPLFAAADQGQALDAIWAWQGTFAYGLQLYFDFSGYSDMAIGIARLFGIRLPLNFDSPYKATGIIDFWRRWHMTLSRFLRDYVYIPLGGSRSGRFNRYRNLFLTMLIGGLWHGAGWNFVLWGGLHGLGLIVNHGWRYLRGAPQQSWWARGTARLVTIVFVMLAWVPFRAVTFDGALAVYSGMLNLPQAWETILGPLAGVLAVIGFSFDGPQAPGDNLVLIPWLIFWLGVIWILPNTQQFLARFEPAYNVDEQALVAGGMPYLSRAYAMIWAPRVTWGIVIGLMFALSVMSLNQESEFLYYQF